MICRPAQQRRRGWRRRLELPLLLFAAFRGIIDELHARLARDGHPDVRPAYGFAMQAIGPAGATASEVGRRLGISKQAAGKTADRLAERWPRRMASGSTRRPGWAGDRQAGPRSRL